MAGESRKVNLVEFEGVQYKAVLTPVNMPSSGALKQKKLSRKWLLLLCGLLSIIIAVFLNLDPVVPKIDNKLPETVTSTTNFNDYYPEPFPTDFTLEKESVKISNGILFYTLKSNIDTSYMTISIQDKPSGLNPESVLRQPDKEPVKLAIGTLYDKSEDGKNLFVIATNDNLLIYAYPSSNMERLKAQSIVTNLR